KPVSCTTYWNRRMPGVMNTQRDPLSAAPAGAAAMSMDRTADGPMEALATKVPGGPLDSAATLAEASGDRVPGRWRFRYDPRFTPPLFITCILLAGHLSFGILESYWTTLLAIATAIAAEIVLSRLVRGVWPPLASAYISGISVGILIRSPLAWPFAICSLLSITSKYALRFRGRHLWNPSNFGICAMLFLASDAVAHLSIQWGNNVWPMLVIWVLGSIIISRLHR